MNPLNKDLETFYDPTSRSGSANAFPYQELVDDFGMTKRKTNNRLPHQVIIPQTLIQTGIQGWLIVYCLMAD